MDATQLSVQVVDPTDGGHPVWSADGPGSEDGPGNEPVLVLSQGGDSGDALEVTGTLDELAAFAHRILRLVYAAQDVARQAAPPPPAVTYNPDALRRWLAGESYSGAGYSRQAGLDLALGPDAAHYRVAWDVETLLFELRNNTHPQVWRTASDVTDRVCAFATDDSGNGDSGVVVTLGVGGWEEQPGLHLTAGHIKVDALLAGAPERGDGARRDEAKAAEVLAVALGHIAEAVNSAVGNWRAQQPPPAERWNTHNNDLGDHCPYSGKPALVAEDDETCPQGCKASAATTDPND